VYSPRGARSVPRTSERPQHPDDIPDDIPEYIAVDIPVGRSRAGAVPEAGLVRPTDTPQLPGGVPRETRTGPPRRGRPDAGSVTAELAVAMPVLVLLLVAALTAVSAVTTQMRCVDAAREVARAAARGDADAAGLGRRIGPPHVTVTVNADADLVRVVVTGRAEPIGSWFSAPEVHATAVAARESEVEP
jgi:hypothetical protein